MALKSGRLLPFRGMFARLLKLADAVHLAEQLGQGRQVEVPLEQRRSDTPAIVCGPKQRPHRLDHCGAMGVDPEKMKQAAKMMKSNPMMRKAAQSMMSNMSPEQMLQMSQQAQKDMQNKK